MTIPESANLASPPQFYSDLHEAAVEYARAGYPIFICNPNSKDPATGHGFKNATTDVGVINQWYEECSGWNIGFEPERCGLAVIEIEKTGLPQLAEFCDGHGPLPRTFTNRSPRGGEHRFYAGSVPSIVRPFKRADGSNFDIDTRGKGGYVLLPPSRTADGEYETIDNGDVTDFPQWVAERIATRKHDRQAAIDNFEFDLEDNLRRAREWLSHFPQPVQGERNHQTFIAACKLKDLGCSPQTILEMLLHWAPLSDDFTEEEVEGRVISAFENGQNAPGNDAVEPSSEAFANLLAKAKIAAANTGSQPAAKVSRFKPIPESEMDALPDPVWLIDDIVEDRTTCIFVGESGSFKTFIVADLCFAVAAGKKTAFGTMPRRTGPVFYGALEGLGNVLKERRIAWREAHDVDRTFPFFGMIAPSLWDEGQWAEFVEQIDAAGQRPVLIALETFTRMADGKENDAEAGATLAKLCSGLIARYDCSVIVVHHNSDKDGASKTGRGTSSLKGNCDSMILVEGDRHTRTADVSVLKHRTFAQPDKPWHLQGRPRGPALVFGLITPDEVRAAKLQRDPYHASHVLAALRKLGATVAAKAVATSILASEFVPTEGFETSGEREAAIKTATNRLNERAALPNDDKKGLWAFADKSSGKWMWSLSE